MYFITLTKQILADMWARKWRSLLALFGIIWGTITVILLLALGGGFQKAFQQNQMALAEGTIFVVPGNTTMSYNGMPKGRTVHIKADTAINVKKEIPDIESVTPLMIRNASITANKKTFKETIFGVGAAAFPLQKVKITNDSRLINSIDIRDHNHVALIGDKIKKELFTSDKSVVGETIKIDGIPFLIIGEVPNPGKSGRVWYDDNLVIPYTTYIGIYGNEDLRFFIFKPINSSTTETVKQNVLNYFAKKYNYNKKDSDAVNIQDTTSFFRFFELFFVGIKIFLGLCGSLTLAVGSLGVANIMFLIVRERTKEIGIRIAVGAKDFQILLQILLESLIIVGLGGLIGFAISWIVIFALEKIGLPSWLGVPKISYTVTIITVTILAILGFLAGFFPAKRAAKMDPVEALGL